MRRSVVANNHSTGDFFTAHSPLNTARAEKKKIVYILSTSYAGSHFLSQLIGGHSRALHLGELAVLTRERFEGDIARECRLERGSVLQGLDSRNAAQFYDVIYSRIDPGIELLVDASKKLDWASRFLDYSDYERKYIHLIRDPRALVNRRLASGGSPRERRRLRLRVSRRFPSLMISIWFAPETDLWAHSWLFQNRRITQFLQVNNLDSTVVTYRDLALNREAEIRRLMDWLGMPFEPSQLEFWKKEFIGTVKRKYEGFQGECFDLKWKSALPSEAQKRVTRIRQIRQYLHHLDIQWSDEGLIRNGAPSGLRTEAPGITTAFQGIASTISPESLNS